MEFKNGKKYKNLDPTKRYSKEQEKSIAKETLGKTTRRSGAGIFEKGDVIAEKWHIEAKATKHDSYALKLSEWSKVQRQAIAHSKIPSMVVDFMSDTGTGYDDRVVLIDYPSFIRLIELVNQESRET